MKRRHLRPESQVTAFSVWSSLRSFDVLLLSRAAPAGTLPFRRIPLPSRTAVHTAGAMKGS